MAVALDSKECLGCTSCIDACDQGALLMHMPAGSTFEKVMVDEETCTDCDDCVAMCASGALCESQDEGAGGGTA